MIQLNKTEMFSINRVMGGGVGRLLCQVKTRLNIPPRIAATPLETGKTSFASKGRLEKERTRQPFFIDPMEL